MKQAMKAFARRFVAGRTLIRRLPVGSARIVLTPESQLKYLRPGRAGFDPILLDWAEHHVSPGMTVWDIGANVGVFAFAAAGRGARVLAVEPDPWMATLLLRSRALNPHLALDVLAAAVADAPGLAALKLSSGGRAGNALASVAGQRLMFGTSMGEVQVPTLTLDALLDRFNPPDFIKIDVEGAELLALAGASRLLHEIRPTVAIEVAGEVADDAAAYFTGAGYSLFDAETGAPAQTCAYNCLAVPPADAPALVGG